MEDSKLRYCSLCLSTIDGENFRALDIFGVLLLKLDFDEDSKYVMCNVCSPKLHTALKFKSTCLDTDNAIISYAEDATVLPIDLKHIYMSERGIQHLSDDVKICRLCMLPAKDVLEYKLTDEQIDMLQIVPEMNTRIIKKPVMCKFCQDSLVEHCNFLKKCWDLQQKIGTIKGQVPDVPSTVPSLHTSIKIEDVDISFGDPRHEGIEIESETHLQEICSQSAAGLRPEAQTYEFTNYVYRSDEMNEHKNAKNEKYAKTYKDQLKKHTLHEDPLEVQMYKCETCNFESRVKKVQMYKCENCDCATKRKGDLKNHMEFSDAQMYKCENCDYETKTKRYLKRHMLIHKDPSKVQMYKCDTCNHETRMKKNLRRHMLKHKDPSQVQMYKCDDCDYETKHKDYLKNHILKHKGSNTQMCEYENCDYETTNKRYLKEHMLLHKDPSQVQMYKCDTCNHETRMKKNLRRHMLKHKDPSQVQMYKCDDCDYKTKHKDYLKNHILKHKGSNTHMCEYENCDYETTNKNYLQKHMLKHKDISEVVAYTCEICNYKAKRKYQLKKHVLIHKEPSERQM